MPSYHHRNYKLNKSLIDDIDSSIELLCGENGSCTVTEVLNFARVWHIAEASQVVVGRARFMEYRVKKIGGGFRIIDSIWDEDKLE